MAQITEGLGSCGSSLGGEPPAARTTLVFGAADQRWSWFVVAGPVFPW